MKRPLSFQQRLVLSFVVIFALFTAGIVIFEGQRVRRHKTAVLEERLDAYAEEIGGATYPSAKANGNESAEYSSHRGLKPSDFPGAPDGLNYLITLMPNDLRVTLIDTNGTVVFDNEQQIDSMDNHANRPEIAAALKTGRGTSIRLSETLHREFLYYARAFANSDAGTNANRVVRVALPYDIEVRTLLKPDNTFLYFVVALFVVGLIFILYLGRYFGAAVKRLREHEAREKTRRLKHEMTGNIAHELRTPVTSIRGFLEIVLGNELDDNRRRQYLERAYAQTQTLSALISDMSLLARIDEKQGAFEFAAIDASSLLEKVRSDVSRGLTEKNITLTVAFPAGLTLLGNESLLYSVFRNLTDNVISHAGEGVEIRVAAQIVEGENSPSTPGRPTRVARVTFSDNGRGIEDPNHLERIFERFYRVNEGRTRDTGGSGLGLSIVKNTVALHGGTISVQSNTPRGLKFTFILPVV
jgi:signal transduction histidine kinase